MSGTGTVTAVEIFILLLAAASVVAVVSRRVRALPYSVALVVLGVGLAALRLPVQIQIGPDLLLAVLLPALVFEGAYRTDIRLLGPNLVAVLLLAIPGVLVTAGLVALALNVVMGLDLTSAFLVGAMLAATDPAAILAVFGELRATRRLSTVVEAESLFNDGTGVVLFALALASRNASPSAGGLAFDLLANIGISIAIGALVGFAASRVLLPITDHLVELTISLVAAYGSYLLAHEVGMSGLIASVICGLVLGNYGRSHGISAEARATIDTVWEFVAFLATTFAFLLIGLSINLGGLAGAWLTILVAIVALLASRGALVYGMLGGGGRLLRRLHWMGGRPMPAGWLHVVAWSGLRGAVAVALALSLPGDLPQRDLLQNVVFGCVLVTLLVQGTTAGLLVRRLGTEAAAPSEP